MLTDTRLLQVHSWRDEMLACGRCRRNLLQACSEAEASLLSGMDRMDTCHASNVWASCIPDLRLV